MCDGGSQMWIILASLSWLEKQNQIFLVQNITAFSSGKHEARRETFSTSPMKSELQQSALWTVWIATNYPNNFWEV